MNLTRREFLKDMVLLGGGLALWRVLTGGTRVDLGRKLFGTEFDSESGLSFETAAAVAGRTDGLYKRLPLYERQITPDWFVGLCEQFVPIMAELGMAAAAVYPKLEVVHFSEPRTFETVRARTLNCGTVIEISDRWLDRDDPWSGQPARAMAMMAHEIVHPAQGEQLCEEAGFLGQKQRLESSADIASMEIMARVYHGGNNEAVFGLLSRLREASLSTMMVLAAIENKTVEVAAMVDQLALDDYEEAKLRENLGEASMAVKAIRMSHGRGGDLAQIVVDLPMVLLISGMVENRGVVDDLWLSPASPQPLELKYLGQFLVGVDSIVAGM